MTTKNLVMTKPYVPKTPLHIAARDGDLNRAQHLFADNNLDINVRDNIGWTPLHHASFHGHAEMVELLLSQKDIAVDAEDNENMTPLHEAARCERWHSIEDGYGHVEIVKLLLAKGANPNAQNDNGSTPLHFVSYGLGTEQKIDIVEMGKELLAKINDVNTTNIDGETPLHITARSGCLRLAKLLLNHDADFKGLNNAKETPVDLAKNNHHPQIASFISRGKYGRFFQPVSSQLVQQAYEELGYQTKSVIKQ
eukprot:Pompholyxophrys_punicea_v1_NODE_330_length_2237_cov_5.916132.p1 type:complete len:252 gc:universal NODE_330_length_2237_cov_5.916132:1541-786(-)